MEEKINNKAWVVAADMGYGHQRTAYPLRGMAFGSEVLNANNYPGIPKKDKNFWRATKSSYEFVSRFRRIPIVGVFLFLFLDRFQKILGYYPKRDLSRANFSGRLIFASIKRGWGMHLIEKLARQPIPLVTTFFTPAFMAEEFHYPGDIYCVICDADISRAWVSLDPKKTRIKYFVPNGWTRDRLRLYGINPEHITLTGYPLPKENIGRDLEIIKKDLGYRLINLDPRGKYQKLYAPLIKNYLGDLPKIASHPLTILFSIGGAGAQKDIALSIITSLQEKIRSRSIRFIVSVGTRSELAAYFNGISKKLSLGGGLRIIYEKTTKEYFTKFNEALRTTDLLMTKPSELSFYAGLGIPIIIEPPIGSQEDFNRRWLLHTGAGIDQENPKYTDEWLDDLIAAGDFAEMAMQGFIEIEKMGAYNIEKAILQNTL